MDKNCNIDKLNIDIMWTKHIILCEKIVSVIVGDANQ